MLFLPCTAIIIIMYVAAVSLCLSCKLNSTQHPELYDLDSTVEILPLYSAKIAES